MTVSDFQISSVIKTYMRNMKNRAGQLDENISPEELSAEDRVMISAEGMKRILFERIGERMTERIKKHEQSE